MDRVVVAGVGIHPFGRFDADYRQIGAVAARGALEDAGVPLDEVDLIFVANVSAEMAKGHNVIEQIGRPGIPIVNVEAACASSASSLMLASQFIERGAARTILCVGVEKAPRGFIANCGYEPWQNASGLGINPIYFVLQAQELLEQTDATADDLADVSVKNHRHAVHNPNAMYRTELTREAVLASPMVCQPLHLLMLCAPNEGAAAAVLMDKDEARRRGIKDPVRLAGGVGRFTSFRRLVPPGGVLPDTRPHEPHRAGCARGVRGVRNRAQRRQPGRMPGHGFRFRAGRVPRPRPVPTR